MGSHLCENEKPLLNKPDKEGLVDIPIVQDILKPVAESSSKFFPAVARGSSCKETLNSSRLKGKVVWWRRKGSYKVVSSSTQLYDDVLVNEIFQGNKKRSGGKVQGGVSVKKGRWVVAGSTTKAAVADVQPRQAL
jgi:hypothetical protein